MLVTNRFIIDEDAAEAFVTQAHTALATLATCPGYQRGQLLRALDDPRNWCLLTEWESVGSYRRALGGFEVKIHAIPLLARSLDEPSAYETLASAVPGGEVEIAESDRAADPGR